MVAEAGTSTAGHPQSEVDGNDGKYRYSAPEMWPDEDSMTKHLTTKESDVYSMGMIAYQVSSDRLVSFSPPVKSHVNLQGPDGERAILRVQRYYCTAEDKFRGKSPKARRRDHRSSLGIPQEMLA